jgi:membrane protein required for beta-lactamase induction
MYLGSLQDKEFVDLLEWLPAKVCWSGLNEALSGPGETYLGALRYSYGDFPFTHHG